MTRPVFRFAPSPNGELHLGHAYSALLNQTLPTATGGRLLLRIEDIDTARCTPEFEAGMLADLDWLGVRWEEPVRRQSEHFGAYETALRQARARRTRLSGLHEPRRDPRPHCRQRSGAAATGRAIPTACRSIRARTRRCPRRNASARSPRVGPSPGGWTWPKRFARIGEPLSWTEFSGEDLSGSRACRSAAARLGRRDRGAHAMCRPAIICRSSSTTRCKA